MIREKTTMEKRLLLFLVLSFALMFLYTQFLSPPPPAQEPDRQGPEGTGEPATGTGAVAPEKPDEQPAPPPTDAPADAPDESGADGTGPVSVDPTAGDNLELAVKHRAVRWVFDRWGGSVRSVRLKNYTQEPKQNLEDPESWYRAIDDREPDGITRRDHRSLTLRVLNKWQKRVPRFDQVVWDVEVEADRVTYRLPWPEAGLEFRKTYTPGDPVGEDQEQGAYHLDVELSVKVLDRKKAQQLAPDGLRLRFVGPAAMPAEPFSPVKVLGAALVSDRADPEELSPRKELLVYPEAEDQGAKRRVEWVGMHSRFFAAVLLSVDPAGLDARQATFEPIDDLDPDGDPFTNLAAGLDFTLDLPAQGDSVTREFLFYVGPMDPDILSVPEYQSFKSIIDYGLFSPIVKILVFLLAAIRSVVGNWGVAIIILTLMVRGSLFPLSRKSQVSMQKYQRQMARLKPKIDDIKKRNAKNKKKQQEEQMKLMKEEGMQMFPAGCLVMFLQLPVFIGLFQALRYTIGLRHSAFLWASDLTAPDQLAGPWVDHGIWPLWDPLYLNILPILMGITWYLSSAMAPKPADPQQAQQMKMMKWMPVIFSIMLYNYAAGLALYMVVSSTWSIFEMKVVRKVFLKPDEGGAAVAATFRKGK